MIIDNDYWISKIKEYSKQTKNFKVYILEYKIINTKLFENTIPLEKDSLNKVHGIELRMIMNLLFLYQTLN